MKTTSYEISKKLKEAGFEAETDFYWYCYDNGRAMRHVADADGKMWLELKEKNLL